MTKRVWSMMSRFDFGALHVFRDSPPQRCGENLIVGWIQGHEEIMASATSAHVPEITQNRLAYLVLNRILLGSSVFSTLHGKCLITPIEVLKTKAGNFAAPKPINGTQ